MARETKNCFGIEMDVLNIELLLVLKKMNIAPKIRAEIISAILSTISS